MRVLPIRLHWAAQKLLFERPHHVGQAHMKNESFVELTNHQSKTDLFKNYVWHGYYDSGGSHQGMELTIKYIKRSCKDRGGSCLSDDH